MPLHPDGVILREDNDVTPRGIMTSQAPLSAPYGPIQFPCLLRPCLQLHTMQVRLAVSFHLLKIFTLYRRHLTFRLLRFRQCVSFNRSDEEDQRRSTFSIKAYTST